MKTFPPILRISVGFISLFCIVDSLTFIPWLKRGTVRIRTQSIGDLHVTQGDHQQLQDVNAISANVNKALSECNERFKDCNVRIHSSPRHRLGLIATKSVQKGEAIVSIPYGDDIILTPSLARKVYNLPNTYNGWTGDAGLLAALLLYEYSQLKTDNEVSRKSTRNSNLDSFMEAWILSLPTVDEMQTISPLLWNEEEQELFQSSSTKNLYQLLDDIEEDYNWFNERIWSVNREKYPEQTFSLRQFMWAMSIVNSRSVFVDGVQRMVPIIDFANHDDAGTEEVKGSFTGVFGTTACVQIKAGRDYQPGDEVFVSYGPKSAAEYLLEYGFIPPITYKSGAVAELTFEINEKDQFVDDKLDILEFHTYQGAPMEPIQSFDIVSIPGQDSSPDPSMIQFLRLKKLGGIPKPLDAFLLEPIFRKDVWGFMSLPVSELNERAVVDEIIASCAKALKKMDSVSLNDDVMLSEKDLGVEQSPKSLCATVRSVERKALTRMLEHMKRESEALDLKEYYQERRLREMGMDSEWDPDDMNSDVGWKRVPGGGDLDY